MSSLTCPLLALVAIALLQGACAIRTDSLKSTIPCNTYLVECMLGTVYIIMYLLMIAGLAGIASDDWNYFQRSMSKKSDRLVVGGATPMPIHVRHRRGWVPIPQYGLIGVRVVGQLVRFCNMVEGISPRVMSTKGQVNSKDLTMYVEVLTSGISRVNIEMTVSYYLEPLYRG